MLMMLYCAFGHNRAGAAGAAAFVALYVALTMQPNGRRKRKRSLKDNAPQRRSNGLEEVFHVFLLGNY